MTKPGRLLGEQARRILLLHHERALRAEAREAFGAALAHPIYVLSDSDFSIPVERGFRRASNEQEVDAIAREGGRVVILVELSVPGQMQTSPPIIHLLYGSGASNGRSLDRSNPGAEFGDLAVGYCVYEREGKVVFAESFRMQT